METPAMYSFQYLSTNIQSLSEIIKLAKLENESQLNRMTQIEQDTFEMQVRAANIGN